MRDRDGNVSLWLGSTTEIHEQKRTEEELRRANKDLEQFAYSASHDLQEPLRGVKIYSELLAMQYRDKLEGEGLDYLEFLMSGGHSHVEMLVRDLLTYTRVNDGHSRTIHRRVAMFADRRSPIWRGSLKRAVRRSMPIPSAIGTGARYASATAFQNPVGNAVKYRRPNVPPGGADRGAPARGELAVLGERQRYRHRAGIPKSDLFGLFKRLHSGDEYSGTGIGLALCFQDSGAISWTHLGRIRAR